MEVDIIKKQMVYKIFCNKIRYNKSALYSTSHGEIIFKFYLFLFFGSLNGKLMYDVVLQLKQKKKCWIAIIEMNFCKYFIVSRMINLWQK